ncbi:MAG: hypothetical protein ABUL62_29765 [Myxococcales bacterium]
MGRSRLLFTAGAACLLAACGGRSRNPGEPVDNLGAAGAAAAGAPNAQAGASGAASGAAPSAGEAGEGGAAFEPPSVDITGRWALFQFEDPVGVQLFVDDRGKIIGHACDAGVPPILAYAPYPCGNVSGTVSGNRASFSLPFDDFPITYAAENIVSADGQRMTGRFRANGGWLDYPTAWLRVADGEAYLPLLTSEEARPDVRYDLRLVSAGPGATDYISGQVYALVSYNDGLYGELGSFYHTELTANAAGDQIQVGPVPPTAPELAVSMKIDVQDKLFTRVTAVTASGHEYLFSASPTPQP